MNKELLAFIGFFFASLAAAAEVNVVTTLPVYADIARAVGGEEVTAASISKPDEDAHFVKPKPSLALMLRHADLFVTTGLDLELWAPTLVDKSGNRSIRDGQPGFVAAAGGVPLLDVPANTSREGGDVHIFGNPHIHTSPLNVKIVAANIAEGLKRVDPAHAGEFDKRLAAYTDRIDRALYGNDLVDLLGSAVLDPLARAGTLLPFLEKKTYEGRPLLERLGGWMGQGLGIRGRKIIAYHKNWIYFTDLFGLEVVDFVEPKPGIPPSARHVHDLLQTIEREGIGVVLASSYFDPKKPQQLAERSGATAVIVPFSTGSESSPDYFALVDLWLGRLNAALGADSSTKGLP